MAETGQETSTSRDVIAVIGMAGRFPGAGNVARFWQNLRDGVESVREFSPEELEASGVDPAQLDDPTYVNVGAPLEDADCFDAAFFGYKPREAELMDPQQRVFLECAYSAIQDAGYDPARVSERVGIFGGVARNTYFIRNAEVYRSLMDQGALYEALLGSEKDFTATRVSFKLDLKGPGINVQGACSTSGIAVHLACQSLLSGECDMALAGGARVRVPLHAGYLYVEGGIPSPDGHCRAFDAGANGCVFGSGVAMLALKRLEDALADGDQIHALILSTAINNDGSAKVGFTAPSVEGQSAVIEEALALAGVNAETIGYVEAHGTGTTLGDPIEIAALTKAFRQSSRRRNHCAIGSVKTNIGHLDAGAGAAGLIKAVLSLKHKQIPGSLNFSQPNPQIDFDRSPFFVNDKLRPWESAETPRRAGVSSFGLGGTNFHAVLEEAPVVEPSSPGRSWQLLPLSARSVEALDHATSDLAEHLAQHPEENLADVAFTLQEGRPHFEHRRFVVCRDVQQAVDQLGNGNPSRSAESVGSDRPLVFMFPGQGSQYANMGRDLYDLEPVFRSEVDACCDKLEPLLGLDLRELLYPDAAREAAASEQLKQTSITQPALFVIEYALAGLWQSWGLEPAAMIGHSVGEYIAATLADVFSVDDALRLLVARGKLMQQQPPGSMLAVQLSEDELQPYLTDAVGLAACNAPAMSVLSGPADAIETVQRKLSEAGNSCRALMTSHAFHSAMMEPAVEPFLDLAREVEFKAPKIRFISSLTGTWITDQQATSPEYWGQQLRQPVHFSRGVCELQNDPSRVLLEVGPGRTLSMLTQQHRTSGGPRTNVVASLRHPREEDPDLACMLGAVGQLWSAGVEIDWHRLYEGQRRRRVSLPTYPFERKRFWLQTVTRAPSSTRVVRTGVDSKPALSSSEPDNQRELTADGPTDPVEMLLCNTWESLLGVRPVGVHDDFFDLGGHSLVALRMLAKIEKVYGKRLPLATLLQVRTIEKLAIILRAEDWEPTWNCLVPIRPGGSKPPLFLIHAAGGNVLVYDDLARHLGEDQPVYGLQARGADDGKPLHANIEEMAATYREEIQEIQPQGPYMLGGYCMGGTVALEIASQLYDEGQEVALLALLDCHNWSQLPRLSPLGRCHYQLQKLDFHWRNLWRLHARERRRFLSGKFSELRRRKSVWYDAIMPHKRRGEVGTQAGGSLAALWRNNELIANRYIPRSYPGPIALFFPMKNYDRRRNSQAIWRDIAQDGMEVHTLQVYPAGMLMEPYVGQLANQLTDCIGRALQLPVQDPLEMETV